MFFVSNTLIVLPILMLVGAFIVRSLSDGTPNNNIYYFIMIGFNDLISAIIVCIILYSFWYKHRHGIFNEVNKMDQEYLRNKPRQNKNKKNNYILLSYFWQ